MSYSRPEWVKQELEEQQKCDEFNAAHPVGTLVRYWRGAKEGPPSGEGQTNHTAHVLGTHSAVVWISGCRGCVALSHVEVIQEIGGA